MNTHVAIRIAVTSAMISVALLIVAYRGLEQCCVADPGVALLFKLNPQQ